MRTLFKYKMGWGWDEAGCRREGEVEGGGYTEVCCPYNWVCCYNLSLSRGGIQGRGIELDTSLSGIMMLLCVYPMFIDPICLFVCV